MVKVEKLFDLFKGSISKYKYELIIFGFLALKLFKYNFSPADDHALLFLFRAGCSVCLLVFVSWIAGRVIKASDEKTKSFVSLFFAFFFVSYSSNSVLLLDGWFKDYDVFRNTAAIVFSLLIFVVIEKPKSNRARQGKAWIPICCFACTALQPLFIITYMPMIAILLSYNNKFGRVKNKYKDSLTLSIISAAAAFLFFGVKNAYAGIRDIAELFLPNLKQMALSIAIVLPLILIFVFIWVNTIKQSNDKVFNRYILFIALEPVVVICSLVTVNSYVNLVMSAVFVQFCFVFYLYYIKNKAFMLSFEKVKKFFDENLFLSLLLILYLSSFSSFAKSILSGLTKSKSWYSLWS